MAAFLGSLEYVLEEGPNNDWLQDESVFIFTIVAGRSARCCSSGAPSRAEEPIVDLSAFTNVNFAFGSLFSFVLGIGLYGLTYLYPALSRRGSAATIRLMIGEALFVSGLAMFLTAPVAGFLSSKIDPRIMMMIGFLGFAAGTWRMTYLTADWDFYELLVPQILRGVSLMLCMVPINNVALGTLAARPAEECVRPVQPDAQSRRRGRARGDQHRADRPQRLPLRAAGRACDLEQSGGAAAAEQHGGQFPGARARRPNGRPFQDERHGPPAGVDDVVHGRVLPADDAVRVAGRLRDSMRKPPKAAGGGGH